MFWPTLIPSVNISISIATNIETMEQSQPADAFCHIYNTAKAMLSGAPVPTCTFSPGYFSCGCKCTS